MWGREEEGNQCLVTETANDGTVVCEEVCVHTYIQHLHFLESAKVEAGDLVFGVCVCVCKNTAVGLCSYILG